MKAIDRLNEYLQDIPKRFRGVHAMDAPEIIDALRDGGTSKGLAVMLANAATFDKIRVGYDLPGEMAEHLFDAEIGNCLDIDSSYLRFPHPHMFVMATDPRNPNKVWEFFLHDVYMLDGEDPKGVRYKTNYRALAFTDAQGGALLPLRDGRTIQDCLETFYEAVKIHAPERKLEVKVLCEFIVKLSLFLTSTKDFLDENIPAVTHLSKKNRNRHDHLRVAGLNRVVGGRFQSAIKLWRERQEPQGGTHGSPRPHIRAAHFQRYWTGKGRVTPIIKFIHPCLVLADSVADVEINRKVLV